MNFKKSIMTAITAIAATAIAAVFALTASAAAPSNVDVTFITSSIERTAVNLWNGDEIKAEPLDIIYDANTIQIMYCVHPGAPLSGLDKESMSDYLKKLITPICKIAEVLRVSLDDLK